MHRQIVLGTRNEGKKRELEILLVPLGFELKTLGNFPDAIEVEETGATFAENAALKAVEQAKHLNEWVLGEDSGLSVAALDGAPGIYSARFSGQHGDNEANNDLLLEKLNGLPADKRLAWYTCSLALSDPQGNVQIACEDRCYGQITTERRGTNGFGYDPLFELQEYHQTFGELGDAIKSVLSHRGRAIRKFARLVKNLAPQMSVA